MTAAELQQVLHAVEPAAVLVPPRVLENIIREAGHLSGLMWHVPHRESFIVDRQTLFRHVEQEELALGPDQLLPVRVLLLAWPEAEELEAANSGPLLRKYWQRLFHASVHMHLENMWIEGKLTAAGIRERVERLGPTRVEEIRMVLVQDHYLAPDPDERSVFIEFAAVFLELASFSAHLLPIYFPGIRNLDEVAKALSEVLPAAELYQRTRPSGASEPAARTASSSEEAHEYYWKLAHSADAAAQQGNVVRAAIQRRRAARVASTARAYTTRQAAVTGLLSLVDRLQKALNLSPEEVDEWRKLLPALLDKADQGRGAVEGALLYDLQQVCLDYEHEIYSLDLVECLLSGGKRPIKRPLPGQRVVRVTRTLRGAVPRLTMARLTDEDRNHFTNLLQVALRRSEEQVRQKFRPLLTSALQDVGLKPSHPLEWTAFRKVIEELLDRIINSGFVTFSELRDTLSRNQLKLPDLANPQDFVRGDPLLRLDRRLSTLLDGVYRPSQFYLRWLERMTALNFGTYLGRLLTLFVTVPFVGALLLLEAVTIVLGHMELEIPSAVYYPVWALLGFFLVGVLHSAEVRRRCAQAGAALGKPLRALLVDGPVWLAQHTSLKHVLESWPFQLCYWYLVKPLVLAGVAAIFFPDVYQSALVAGLVFLAAMFFVNSRPGQAIGAVVTETLFHFVDLLRAGLLPGLLSFVSQLFKQILHLGDALLFKVEEWLRFRAGDSRAAMAVRTSLSVLWFPIAYIIRFNVVVFIEPCFNPLKYPLVFVTTKIMLPLLVFLGQWLPEQLTSVLGTLLGNALAWWVVFWLPDAVVFIIWEMKENWSLYRANRPPALGPVSLGGRSETMRGLLQPGFHTGTIPKLYARLRQAERQAGSTGTWSGVCACRSALAEVEQAVNLFVTREFCELLAQTPAWQGPLPRVGQITLATNMVRVELQQPGALAPEQSLWLEFENRGGSLIAGIAVTGWLAGLSGGQRILLHNALATLYKLAGVDRIAEPLLDTGRPVENADSAPLTFRQIPITWEQCVTCWPTHATATMPPRLLGDGVDLSPAPVPGHPEMADGLAKEMP